MHPANSKEQPLLLRDLKESERRFRALVEGALTWLGELLKLRDTICQKKEIISKIRFGTCELESDRVKNKLQTLIEGHTRLKDLLLSASAHIHLVLNSDRLSLAEAQRIRTGMAEIGKPIYRVVVNKYDAPRVPEAIARAFADETKVLQPRHEGGGSRGLPLWKPLRPITPRHSKGCCPTGRNGFSSPSWTRWTWTVLPHA